MPLGGCRAGQRQQVRLATSVQLAGGAGAWPLAQRRLQPLLDEALANPFDGHVVQPDSGRNGGVRLPRIGTQQHLRALVLPDGDRALGGQCPQLLPLLVREVHDVLLVHRSVLHRPATLHKPSQPLYRGEVLV